MLAYEVNRLSGGEQNVETEEEDPWSQFIEARDMNIVRCPDAYNSHRMIQLLEQIQSEGDSIGSEVTCLIRRCPLGLGEPVFDKVHALLGHAMLSIPACKGIQFGEGFDVVKMRGSHHNDPITGLVQSPREESNGSSSSRQCNGAKAFYTMSQNQNVGLQGGISNGYPIYFRVPFKPPSTIGIPQSSVLPTGEKVQVSYKGRHDPCIGPRAVPIVEAMTALVLMDLLLIQNNNATDKLNI